MSCGDLELIDQTSHEPVIIGALCEVHVALTLNVDDLSWSRDLANVVVGLAARADIVTRADEKAHRHRVNLRDVNQVGLLDTIKPLVLKLLESVFEAVHDPVLL